MSRRANDGSAMIVVMCMMFVLTGLCLMLLRAASALPQNTVRYMDGVQCRINAEAVADVLAEAIEDCVLDGAGPAAGENGKTSDAALKALLGAAASGERGIRERDTFRLELDGLPGETTLELYRTDTDMEMPDAWEGGPVILYVKVTSTVGSKSRSAVRRFVPAAVPEAEEEEADGFGEDQADSGLRWRWSCLEYGRKGSEDR